MDLISIRRDVRAIKDCASDLERAHAMEDDLRERFIAYVAKSGDTHIAEMAKAVLRTSKLDFARHCA